MKLQAGEKKRSILSRIGKSFGSIKGLFGLKKSPSRFRGTRSRSRSATAEEIAEMEAFQKEMKRQYGRELRPSSRRE